MSCGRFRELLSPHLDGDLSTDEEKSLSEHLETCEACRMRLDELRAVVDVVRGIPAPDAPVGLATEVMAKIPRRRKRGKLLWLTPVAAAACLLLVVKAFDQAADRGPLPTKVATDRGAAERTLETGGYVRAPEEPEGIPEKKPRDDAAEGLPKEAVAKDTTASYEADEGGSATGGGAEIEAEAPPAPAGPDFGIAGKRGAPRKPAQPAAEPEPVAERPRRETAASIASRKYAVSGADPDTAAGVILAELNRRRDRNEVATRAKAKSSPAVKNRVVQDSDGEVSGMLLELTEEELEFVTALLCERPGVKIDRVNGDRAKKRDGQDPDPSRSLPGRLNVELRFR
jgi:hypothetical protein